MRAASEFRARALGCTGWTIRWRHKVDPRYTAILHTPTRKFVGTGDTEEQACRACLDALADEAHRLNESVVAVIRSVSPRDSAGSTRRASPTRGRLHHDS